MTLVKRNLLTPTIFSDLFDNDFLTPFGIAGPNGVPAVNVVDNDDSYEIELSAPGFKKEDFNVTLDNGILTISGDTKKENEEKKKNYTRREFSSASFSRSFTLPKNVKEEGIKANYDAGVLKLTLEKTEKELAQRKKVAIQ